MTDVNPYVTNEYKRRNYFFRCRCVVILLLCLLLRPDTVICQLPDDYEEVSVSMNVQRIGNLEIIAIIHEEEIYLPIKELFDYLKIKNTASSDFDTVSGFFIDPQALFAVYKLNNHIIYKDKTYQYNDNDLLQTSSDLFIKSPIFGEVFGLNFLFQFRSLSVTLSTKLELPAIRDLYQAQMRRNISQLKGEKPADTTIGRTFPLFRFGMADWALLSNRQTEGNNLTRLNLRLGAMLFGGEANVHLNHSLNQRFEKKQQFFNWRYVNNDNAALRQVTAGTISPQSTASIFNSVIGVQLTNTPTTYRRSFGTFTIGYYTEPAWMVELYVNNVLVDYTKADASGFFSFEVPVVYGNSTVKFRYYGPWGEERVKEQNISIPFNFLPAKQLEYSLTAGIVQDEYRSRYSRAGINYGLSKHITIGAGMEYLSSIRSGNYLPFVNASVRLGNGLLLSGEHVYRVRTKGVLTYRRPSNLQFELFYQKYDRNQTAVKFNFLEEQRAVVSMPFRAKKFSVFSRLTLNRYKLLKYKQMTGEFLISGVYAGISSNLTTQAIFSDPRHPLVFTNLSMSFRLPKGIRFTPQVQYEYRPGNFSIIKGEVEKAISKNGYLNLSYQANFVVREAFANIGLRYNFSFAQTYFALRQSGKVMQSSQLVSGSLMYNDLTKTLKATSQPNVGRGGVILVPFLDMNCNGLRELNEPGAPGLKLRINGGRVKRNDRDTTILINNLESYVSYLIELDKNSFDNIAWLLKNQTIKFTAEPNYFKQIEVPVAVAGEVSGTVYVKNGTLTGLGRIIVNIYNSDNVLASRVITESDGYFSYLGLAPGKYTLRIDEAQLLKLNMLPSQNSTSFTIKSSKEGDVVEGLQLIVIREEHSQE